MSNKRPVLLIILDGWGVNSRNMGNPVLTVRPQYYSSLLATHPSTLLEASGTAVGLPEGQMGNSEVGHLNIGAGRIVYQDLVRITNSIESGELESDPLLDTVMSTGNLHLMGLVSDGGVHSHIEHLYALLEIAKKKARGEVFIHVILDGRDTPPASGYEYIRSLTDFCRKLGIGRIATVSGRFYAMDRDNRWERVEKAYRALACGEGREFSSAALAVEEFYKEKLTDEFIPPCVMVEGGRPIGSIGDGDGVLFFNFRADRAREITRALTQEFLDFFPREHRPQIGCFVCMTPYDEQFLLPVLFPKEPLKDVLGHVLMRNSIKQLRIAETEKYAHVTYFFNGGAEHLFENEDRILIDSPKDVPTYDLKPQMSAYEITENLIIELRREKYGVVVVNYANPDMVGHTGNMEAAMKAVLVIDECLARVCSVAGEHGVRILLTSDHGNIEQIVDYHTGSPYTAHTSNNVPFILISDEKVSLRDGGILADIAPTILDLLGLEAPRCMTGRSLIIHQDEEN